MEKFNKKSSKSQKIVGRLAIILVLCFSLSLAGATSVNATQDRPRGGTLIVEQPEDITHLFQDIEPGGAWYADYSLFDRLVEVDTDTADIIPGLAKTWDISSDGMTYTFHLYENVKWHDGMKFSSVDVKYTYDYIMENGLPGKDYLKPTASVEAPDDNTIIMKLSSPNAAFLAQLGTWTNYLCIIPQHVYDVGIPWEENPNIYGPTGTGPFKFDELRPGEYARFVRFDDYHKGRPYLDTFVWQIVPDVAVAIQMLTTNEIQLVGAGSGPSFSELGALSRIRGISVRGAPLGGEDLFNFEFNSGDPNRPFHDVRVRKAICQAINRQELSDKVFFGYCGPGESLFTADIPWAFNPDAKYPEYDPAAAETLLDAAGYKRGANGIRFSATIEFGNYFGPQNEGLAAVIAEQLAVIGIDIQYTLYEWLTWFNKVKIGHDFDMSIFLDYAGPDPDRIRRQLYTETRGNGGLYSNARVDELFDLAVQVSDLDERAKYYYEIQDIIAEELPYIALIDQDWWYAARDDYHDFWFDEGVEATRLNPWQTWWEGGTVEPTTIVSVTTAITTAVTTVSLFPRSAIGALAAIIPGLTATVLVLRRRNR